MKPVDNPTGRRSAKVLLEAGRGRSPVSYDVELGRARHRAWVEQSAPLPSWADGLVTAAPSSLAGVLAKLLATLACFGAAAAIAYWARSAPAASSGAKPALAPLSAATLPLLAAADGDVRDSPGRASAACAGEAAASGPDQALEPRAPQRAARPVVSLRPKARPHARGARVERQRLPERSAESAFATPTREQAAPLTAAAGTAPSPSADGAASKAAPAVAAKERETQPPPEPAAHAQAPADVQELRELAAAERALSSDPKRALALVVRGEQRFPNGYLEQERAYVGIMALLGLGRVEQARAEAARFFPRYPNTPYAARIRRALQTSKER